LANRLDEIVKECKQYNKLAQKLLYEMYAPKMRGVCLRYISNQETLKDVVQEGFIKVFSNIKQYSGTGSFEGWIKRIFINTAISHIRKYKNSNNIINIEDINEANLHDPVDQNINESSISVMVENLSETELLNALNRIPENYRTVFNLSCIENMKHDEIAKILNIDTVTSRTRLLRARGLLQKELNAFCLEKSIQ
jgi:RNA polymerase sigma-70 factor (ECF subfamily)